MNTIDEALIYEFMENKYDELSARDGGYYPSKHDSEVRMSASNEFSIALDKIDEIYANMSQVAADTEIAKIKKLPQALRKKAYMERMQDIVKNNKDLPFYQLEGPAKKPIKSGNEVLYDEYYSIAEQIGEFGWTIPFAMGLQSLDVLKDKVLDLEQVNGVFSKYYTNSKLKLMRKHVRNSLLTETHKELFNDCMDSFEDSKYLLCISALVPILEGVLSRFGDDAKDVRMKRICRFQLDDAKLNGKLITCLIWTSNYSFINTLYEKSDFSADEPEILNRHWILHGRTEAEYDKTDCLRIINAIYSLSTLLKYTDEK